MSLMFFVALIVASTIAVLIQHRSRYPTRTHLMMNKVTNTPGNTETMAIKPEASYRGFVIEPGADCCQAALELQKLTFCYLDRISLPLASCNKQTCSCELREIKDRRKQQHRRSKLDRRNQIRFEPDKDDRRRKKGRREKDQLWCGGYVH